MLPLLLWLRLVTASSPVVAEAACSEVWTEDGDARWECVVELETIRCEVQGWCS